MNPMNFSLVSDNPGDRSGRVSPGQIPHGQKHSSIASSASFSPHVKGQDLQVTWRLVSVSFSPAC